MKPYKGLINIICSLEAECPKGLTENVQPECVDCPDCVFWIVDLEGKPLFECKKDKSLKVKQSKPKKKTGTRIAKPGAKTKE